MCLRASLRVGMLAVLVCVAGASAASGQSPFAEMDKNHDNQLSVDEFRGPDRAFKQIDTDDSGYVTREEMRTFREKRGQKPEKPAEPATCAAGPYEDLVVEEYDPDRAWRGNVLFVDSNAGRIVEVDHDGKVVWEGRAPRLSGGERGGGCAQRLSDIELLQNGNMLVMIDSAGQLIEVTRTGEVVWRARRADYEPLFKPLELGELNQKSPWFNADCRGLDYFRGK